LERTKVKQRHPLIVKRKDICGGRPTIAGTRIKVSQIVLEYEHLGWTPDEIARAHPHLTLSQIHAALAYYYDHPEEINEEMKESEELVESLKGEYVKRPTAEAVQRSAENLY